MTDDPVRAALVAALSDWQRHAVAVGAVALVVGVAAVLSSPLAFYGAGLVAFTVWMAWFVLTGAEFLRVFDAQSG